MRFLIKYFIAIFIIGAAFSINSAYAGKVFCPKTIHCSDRAHCDIQDGWVLGSYIKSITPGYYQFIGAKSSISQPKQASCEYLNNQSIITIHSVNNNLAMGNNETWVKIQNKNQAICELNRPQSCPFVTKY